MRLSVPGCAAAVAVAAVVGVSSSEIDALAISPAEPIARRQLISQAEAAHDAGNHAAALDLARRAGALQMSISLRYFLAREQEEIGAFADGFAAAEECVTEAENDPKLRNRESILQECRGIKTRLDRRIGRVVVVISERPQGLRVRIAGNDVDGTVVGLPYVVAPGTIAIEATAPDRMPFDESVSVGMGKTTRVEIMLARKPSPPSAVAATKSAPPVAAVEPASNKVEALAGTSLMSRAEKTPRTPPVGAQDTTSTSASTSVEASAAGTKRTTSPAYELYATVAGGILVVAGTVSYLVSGSEFSSIKDACNSTPQRDCTASRRADSVSTIQTLDRVAIATWIAGAVLVGGGLVDHYLTRGRESTSRQASVGIDPFSRALTFETAF